MFSSYKNKQTNENSILTAENLNEVHLSYSPLKISLHVAMWVWDSIKESHFLLFACLLLFLCFLREFRRKSRRKEKREEKKSPLKQFPKMHVRKLSPGQAAQYPGGKVIKRAWGRWLEGRVAGDGSYKWSGKLLLNESPRKWPGREWLVKDLGNQLLNIWEE